MNENLQFLQAFLKNPQPKKTWCGPSIGRQTKNGSINNNWRPFVSGLGGASINKALKILDSFFNYLVQTNYLRNNRSGRKSIYGLFVRTPAGTTS